MDYLNDGHPRSGNDLEVDGLWLMPITKSPSYHKYDVVDYYQVDPQYGTLEDFRRLIREAHKRGIKVIIDLVVNHTSNQHPWFVSASKDKNSPYRDYYIWADAETDIHEKVPWGQPVWHETYPGSGDYYYGLFWSGMPELNYDNPRVREEIIKIGKFWLKQGADGFRLDAAKYIYPDTLEAKNHEWWSQFRREMQKVKPNVYLVGEVWDAKERVAPYYGELDTLFNFDLSDRILQSLQQAQDAGIAALAAETGRMYVTSIPVPSTRHF
ncbi:alpha-amylase family glycosyl hydrolase [Polycladomyces subterraneus]|uniref:Alpha-amylase family glycosyl hydrolase n=1 Tax=Polycladomyces subterraneus TaxID=1016997 RepID=A0ABT8IKL2_9BACL|nr:alpha-amylase family glycosyl hydrolase [Polycladomyces subterraneus]MDN4593318.1 alpha-amylase family glycosyl hydrolase [Polycladomyces subterraneus]